MSLRLCAVCCQRQTNKTKVERKIVRYSIQELDKVFVMNARSHIFELAVEPWQVEESLLSIFHPILFHRY